MELSIHTESWASRVPFRITNREFTSFDSIVVELFDGHHYGRSEAHGVFYLDDSLSKIADAIDEIRPIIQSGICRQDLQILLPPGGARNALDCALWDLECKRSGRTIWELLDMEPAPLRTVYTIGMENSVEAMASKVVEARSHRLFKVKLDGRQPVERMQAIRHAHETASLVVDANQGWTYEQLTTVAPALAELGVEMIEQPLPRGNDAVLADYNSPVPLCADESCLHVGDLEYVSSRYQMINIKLDKAGGLTHGFELAQAARSSGLKVMVGCMGGTSLAMAPAYVLGCICDLVDIDGPLLLKNDRRPGIEYQNGVAQPFTSAIWG